MAFCKVCSREKDFLNLSLKVCLDCIREKPKETFPFIFKAHKISREKFNLPPFPPKSKDGIKCKLCQNECQIGENEKGYCGLRENRNKKLYQKSSLERGLFFPYYDQIPTNCCASWFCGAEKEAFGKNNLAVFFYGCSFNCLFCQNYTHKLINKAKTLSKDLLIKMALSPSVYCLCFFGGSPEPQLPFVLKFLEEILEKKKIRICFEWNGSGEKSLVEKAAKICLKSKGIIKFDLKAFDENLNYALCGVSNKRTLENFEFLGKKFFTKADYPMLTATTLLVPGYVDKIEVEKISKFISSINPEIPYSLLIFFPAFCMADLPITPKAWALECFQTAKKYLKNVNLGNIHLLS